MNKRKILGNISCFIALLIILSLLQSLLVPKYVSGIVEGSLIEEYYSENSSHDIIFVGDCEVYENFSPVRLWENYGTTSFIRGSAQQLIWQSYYLLEETLKYETPKIVVFNVLSMKYNEPQKETYNRMTLDGMKLSMTKINSIKASMTKDEHLIEYIFPLLRFHSRWDDLSKDDFQYMFSKKKLFHNGYYMRVDSRPVKTVPKGKKLPDYTFGDNAYYYLNKMVNLCKKNNIELVLVKAPTLYPYWYGEWDEQMEKYAEENNLLYVNFLDKAEEIGIDYQTDTYDGGLHLNLSGAEKLTDYFADILNKNFTLPDHRNEKSYSDIWAKKIDFYYGMKNDQIEELKKYGYLKGYGGKQ